MPTPDKPRLKNVAVQSYRQFTVAVDMVLLIVSIVPYQKFPPWTLMARVMRSLAAHQLSIRLPRGSLV